MRRWRCLAHTLILTGLLGAALTASVASLALGLGLLPDPSGEIAKVGAWVVGIVLGFLAVVGGTVQLIVKPIIDAQNAATRRWLKEAVDELHLGFRGLMDLHVESRNPHPVASDAMHEPLKRADEQLLKEIRIVRARLGKLSRAHNEAMKLERNVAACMAVPAREAHREDDPPDADFTKRLEVPALSTLIIPVDDEDPDDDESDQP